MPFTLAAMSILATASLPPVDTGVHAVRVEHRGRTVEVEYRPIVRIVKRQSGFTPATRQGATRCTWQAQVDVDRHVRPAGVTDDAGLRHRIDDSMVLRGDRHGDCTLNARAIERDVARRAPLVAGHVERVAQADRARLHADLDAARLFAAN